MLHSTTQGWFLSRATSSRIACAVNGLRRVVDGLGGERRHVRAAEDAAGQAHVDADRGGLVDHDDAVAVGVVEDLLGVRVVRGAERVRAEPVHQREVVDHERVVVALAAHGGVLVLAEALERERLAVDEEPRAVHLHRADADGQRVRVDQAVAPQLDLEVVEVALAGPPGMDVRDRQLARGAAALRDRVALGVAQRDAHLRLPLDLDLVRDGSGRAVETGHDASTIRCDCSAPRGVA